VTVIRWCSPGLVSRENVSASLSAGTAGHRLEEPAVSREPLLTSREQEVLRLIAQGYTYKEIARAVDLGEGCGEPYVGTA
jgi:DNA-binding NarL/FixJ family response regulator